MRPAIKEPDRIRSQRAKKDRNRWCKGKVGVEHQPECLKYSDAKGITNPRRISMRWRILSCKACGKELDIFYGNNKRKPWWVIMIG